MDVTAWACAVPTTALIAVTSAEGRPAARRGRPAPGMRAAGAWAYASLAVLLGAGNAGGVAAGQFTPAISPSTA